VGWVRVTAVTRALSASASQPPPGARAALRSSAARSGSGGGLLKMLTIITVSGGTILPGVGDDTPTTRPASLGFDGA